ncbi:DUF1501 domain-containing protein [Bryobacter aggregatus]|uniref:DUF1501 domain-containing protein n=1 Tax=Bryobacter aggregatus TaxID=360054 RepID=UPI001EE3484F|nr:DUF1501 domain-containing protein [Bryobacter aggregatus]
MERRKFLETVGAGFGMYGLAGILEGASTNPLAVRAPHFPAKAKRIIYLFLNGGPSQVDTFDPKPMLAKYHGKPMPAGNLKTERKTGNLMQSPFEFRRCGKSGIEVSEIFPKLGGVIDEFCVIRSMYTDRPNHEPSLLLLNSGDKLPGRPSMGSWVTYGLGSENQNLPGYVVLCPGLPVLGHQNWAANFLPAVYQGTYIPLTEKDPKKLISYIRNSSLTPEKQRKELDLLEQLNQHHMAKEGHDSQLEATIQSAEIAFRMQAEAPDAFDITKEPEAVRARYGDSDFGRGALIARRLIERGVRMVQLYHGNFQPWDTHDDIELHRPLADQSDGAIAALIQDLKASGLLDETIVLVGGEFGRTPAVEVGGLVKVQNGRDHNNHGFSYLVAGGGFKGGTVYGSTDEFGFAAQENKVHIHDLHATVLNQMGLDHTKLTYRYSGRDYRLTDVAGNVVKGVIA